MSVPLSSGTAHTGETAAGDRSRDTGGDVQRAAAGRGRTVISPSVVATVAGVAARGVRGVHNLSGAGAAGTLDRVRSALPVGGGDAPADGVQVEVGEVQAAFDLRLVADYGVPVRQLAEDVRARVIAEVQELTGYEVAEVNVAVVDVYLGEEDQA